MKRVESYEDLPDWIKLHYGHMLPYAKGAYAYLFTDEEREGLEYILKNGKQKVSEENIAAFIFELEGIASQKKYEILDTPKKGDTRAARQEIIDDGKTFLKHLEGIVSCRRQWVQYDDLESRNECVDDDDPELDGRFNDPITLLKFKVWARAHTTEKPLREMITALEKFQSDENKNSGRDRANSDNFVRLIINAYFRHIGKPSTYPGGRLFLIVECLYSILDIRGKDGKSPKDPTRAIRQALKK